MAHKRTMENPQQAFSSLELKPDLLSNLESLGYSTMTPIQAQSLPAILNNRDVIAQAKTGSGKTAAFGLGLLNQLKVSHYHVQALVLCPTRELADQVAKEVRRLARQIHNIKVLVLCGGMPLGPQIGSLEHGAHIVVGTPGRIEEHLRKRTLQLNDLTMLVLDEADRMLDMGFQDAVERIVDVAPVERQTLLYSATYPPEIESIADRVMNNPLSVQSDTSHNGQSIRQVFYLLPDQMTRLTGLQLLLLQSQPQSSLVFCNTRAETQQVVDGLSQQGFSALALHGDLEQCARDQVLVRFANKSISILVATDVAARGLDIAELDAVFNYQLSRDPQVHTHRVGRTGRAGNQGVAFSLYQETERYKLELLADSQGHGLTTKQLPPLSILKRSPKRPLMATLQIDGGKKQKVRPGDIVGALTGDQGIVGKQIGKIDIFDNSAFVAVEHSAAKRALRKISEGTLKGRSFRVRRIRG